MPPFGEKPVVTTTRTQAIAECRRRYSAGESGTFFYLAATPFVRDEVKARFYDYVSADGLAGNFAGGPAFPIACLDEIPEDILEWAGASTRVMDTEFRQLVVELIIRGLSLEDTLMAFKQAAEFPGFYAEVARLIGELISAGVEPEALNHDGPEDSSDWQAARLCELGLIYREYLAVLNQGEEIDSQARWREAGRYVAPAFASFGTKPDLLIVDGISESHGLSRTQKQFLEVLAGTFKDVWVVPARSETTGLSLTAQALAVLKAPGMFREVREIARFVKTILLERDYPPDQICIAVRNWTSYVPALLKAFNEYGIPCDRSREGRQLSEEPLIRVLINFLESTSGDWDRHSIINVFRSGYFIPPGTDGLSGTETDEFDLLSRRCGIISGLEQWRRRLRDTVYLGWIDWMAGLMELLPEKGPVPSYTHATRLLLEKSGILKSVFRRGDGRDLRVLQSLEEVLRNMELAADSVPQGFGLLDLPGFIGVLKRAVSNVWLPEASLPSGGIRIVPASDVRSLGCRVLIIPGLLEGEFPVNRREDWLIPDDDRTRLSDCLETSRDWQRAEEAIFAECASSECQLLVLSYPDTDAEGKEQLPSRFVEEVLSQAGNRGIQVDQITIPITKVLPERVEQALNRWELLDTAVKAAFRVGPGGRRASLNPDQRGLAFKVLSTLLPDSLEMIDRSRGIDRARWSGVFGPWDGYLEDPKLCGELKDRYLPGVRPSSGNRPSGVLDAGRLSTYGQCPFAYFCKYELRVEGLDEPETGISAIDKGNILHRVLAAFLEPYVGVGLDPSPGNRSKYEKELVELAERFLGEYEARTAPFSPELWDLEKQSIIRTLKGWLDSELKFLSESGSKYHPLCVERWFGHENDPVEVSAPGMAGDQISVRLLGKIDRIDAVDGTGFVVYDYKTSSAPDYKNIIAGINLQLQVYLIAARRFLGTDLEPRGGAFISLRDFKRNNGLWCEDLDAPGVSSRRSMDRSEFEAALDAAEKTIVRYAEAMSRGNFVPKPRTTECPPWCEYSQICRYDKLRVNGKSMPPGYPEVG